jgi:hypothetical protein
MVKIGSAGEHLPADAVSWDAALLPHLGLMFTAGNVSNSRLDYADTETACKALTVAGFSDWRIPTRDELLAIVDQDRYDPAINTDFFRDTKSNWYWTSKPCAWNNQAGPSGSVWIVYFDDGFVGDDVRDDTAFARAVRAVPAGQ